jgi:arylformamidase
MSWIDISVPLREGVITWQGDPPFRAPRPRTIAGGDHCNVTQLAMGAHAGTHIDAPIHFIDGAAGVEQTPLDVVMGPAWVVDATTVRGAIDGEVLRRLDIPDRETRILFKTTNGSLWSREEFDRNFVAVTADAAAVIVHRGVRLVGIDYLSVAPFGASVPTHTALLGAGVVVLEGLDLSSVDPGPYDLICLPLRIVGSDGGPARALLRSRDGGPT